MHTPESEFMIPRRKIAEQLAAVPITHLNRVAPTGVTLGGLVLAMGDSDHYVSTPLVQEPSSLSEERTGHSFLGWRVVVPAAPDTSKGAITSLVGISFGIEPHTFPPKLVEQAMDTEILEQQELHPEVSGLFKAVGGDMVRKVRNSGDLLFAAIERRRVLEGSFVVDWSQLVYSKKLSDTTGQVSIYEKWLKQDGLEAPQWVHEAKRSRNKDNTARLMALSGLATNLIRMPEETEEQRKPRFWKRLHGR